MSFGILEMYTILFFGLFTFSTVWGHMLGSFIYTLTPFTTDLFPFSDKPLLFVSDDPLVVTSFQ